ncbi:hemerythrin domain-containing protein [Cryptosporangium arvum]|uniref:Hemerythrin-like domain-containing protein n=1 Tax=Cryptosporangium arvum DSM 44712 TaxID=927661 RepID=A0A010YRG9_9ACTN|nr:hemerythrin domain-containing protein [Cryptosporangium arvum]EXG82780.1 hypothetical protein CryarDRAFT_3981 [Cryptosporangium arvum DSM 44712]
MTPEPVAIAETRLLHTMHRAATSLLAEAATRDTSAPAALTELRDFLVAALRHHHESEDDVLWPRLAAAGAPLADLSAEHDVLDAALDRLAAAAVPGPQLAAAAADVRDLVHQHLDHEEPVLFPALAAHLSDQEWAAFSSAVIASAPPVGLHLNFGFFERVGTPEELAAVAANLPPEALAAVPVLREQARATLKGLGS